MKVVLDTNILISALFWRGSPYKVLRSGLEGRYELVLSAEIIAELRRKLDEKFHFPLTEDYIRLLRSHSTMVQPTIRLDVVTDDLSDNRVLECAYVADADYIVSGDSHLLSIIEFRGIKIIKPERFLELI